MPRRTLAAGAVVVLLVLLTSAVAFAMSRAYYSGLSGAQEVPVRVTNAQGEAGFRLSEDGQSMDFQLNVANIENVMMAHLHLGPAGSNGPIVVWLYPRQGPPPTHSRPGFTSGTLAEGHITAADLVGPLAGKTLADLRHYMEVGEIYANVHTNDFVEPPNTGPGDFPGGEIRGQLSSYE
jgi:hypothetical protein